MYIVEYRTQYPTASPLLQDTCTKYLWPNNGAWKGRISGWCSSSRSPSPPPPHFPPPPLSPPQHLHFPPPPLSPPPTAAVLPSLPLPPRSPPRLPSQHRATPPSPGLPGWSDLFCPGFLYPTENFISYLNSSGIDTVYPPPPRQIMMPICSGGKTHYFYCPCSCLYYRVPVLPNCHAFLVLIFLSSFTFPSDYYLALKLL
jgi:hypothetical protein